MNGFGGMRLALLLAVAAVCHGDVQTSTPCSLSFYRYLFNLPGEQIRPNVPEGTYVFGKRVGPASPEGQASDFRPSVLKPAPSFEAPQYLPPVPVQPSTTTTTTVAPKPSTSAPLYIPPPPPPPPSPYYPGEASNAVSVVQPAKPACEHPEHGPIESGLVPPYRFEPLPKFEPQPTFFVPKFAPLPQKTVPSASENDVQYAVKQPVAPVHRYPVPTPPPQFLRPYVAPATAPTPAENCDKHRRPEPTAPPRVTVTSTAVEPLVETRQNEIVVLPEVADAPRYKSDCTGHKQQQQQQQNVVVESLGVPSTDYGVVSVPSVPSSASAGYSYDKPSQPLPYPSNAVGGGYAYPKPSPSFEYPAGGASSPYAGQATALFETESSAAGGTEDGDLVVLKV